MSKEPMPCPCCGSSVAVTYGIGPAGKYANIRCNCGLQTRPVLGAEKDAAMAVLAIWNERKGCA